MRVCACSAEALRAVEAEQAERLRSVERAEGLDVANSLAEGLARRTTTPLERLRSNLAQRSLDYNTPGNFLVSGGAGPGRGSSCAMCGQQREFCSCGAHGAGFPEDHSGGSGGGGGGGGGAGLTVVEAVVIGTTTTGPGHLFVHTASEFIPEPVDVPVPVPVDVLVPVPVPVPADAAARDARAQASLASILRDDLPPTTAAAAAAAAGAGVATAATEATTAAEAHAAAAEALAQVLSQAKLAHMAAALAEAGYAERDDLAAADDAELLEAGLKRPEVRRLRKYLL